MFHKLRVRNVFLPSSLYRRQQRIGTFFLLLMMARVAATVVVVVVVAAAAAAAAAAASGASPPPAFVVVGPTRTDRKQRRRFGSFCGGGGDGWRGSMSSSGAASSSSSRLWAVEKTTSDDSSRRPPINVRKKKDGGNKKRNQKSSPRHRKSSPSSSSKKNDPRRQQQHQHAAASGARHQPRPVLTSYDVERHYRTNEERLVKEIQCRHFAEGCSGCKVSRDVAEIDIVRSARLYFRSASVRRKLLRPGKGGFEDDDSEDDDDEDFYDVVVPSDVTGWRTQAKLAAAPAPGGAGGYWSSGGCELGLYERGTHDVMTIPDCAVHHPSINRAVQAVEAASAKVRTAAYNENTREGGLRYVQFQVERSTGRVCLTLVWNTGSIKDAQPAVSRLVKELTQRDNKSGKSGKGGGGGGKLWHSIWVHCNDGIGNNIFHRNPKRWYRVMGPEFVREPLPVGEVGWLYFSPLAFRQGNLDGFDVIANDVARAVPGGSKVCELYAGIGVLGLSALCYHASEDGGGEPLVWVRCSDENPANPRCFRRSVDSLPSSVTGRGSGGGGGRRSDNNDEQGGGGSNSGGGEMTLAEMAALVDSGPPPASSGSSNERRTGDKTSYMVASAAAALRAGQALGADVLIVDPPRKGLEEDVVRELCKPFIPDQPYVETTTLLTIPDDKVNWTNDVRTLVYVSCGFDTLARDTDALLSSPGGWFLESATGYVLFPGSDHVETLSVFQRT